MTFLGADTTALRTLGTGCAGASERLEQLMAGLVSASQRVEWVGEDAEDFRDAVLHVGVEGRAVARRLHVQGQQLDTEADQQDDASSTGTDQHSPFTALPRTTSPVPLTETEAWKLADPAIDQGRSRARGHGENGPRSLGEDPDADRGNGSGRDDGSGRRGGRPSGLRSLGDAVDRAAGVAGVIPDALETAEAWRNGDVGGVIGNGLETALAAIPHPAADVALFASDALGYLLPGEGSAIEQFGDLVGDIVTPDQIAREIHVMDK